MRTVTGIAAVAVGVGGVRGATAWPGTKGVETGRPPDYPDLRVREYSASPKKVAEAATQALGRLPGWSVIGSGGGPAGHSIQALHETPPFGFQEDVTLQIRQDGPRTRVSVRSRSRAGPWEFCQKARDMPERLSGPDG